MLSDFVLRTASVIATNTARIDRVIADVERNNRDRIKDIEGIVANMETLTGEVAEIKRLLAGIDGKIEDRNAETVKRFEWRAELLKFLGPVVVALITLIGVYLTALPALKASVEKSVEAAMR